jgi:glycosyltransferase involved in cell wall biosynthesis
MTDPLGRSQVLPYLAGLAQRGHRISLLSMEKPERFAAQGETVRALCSQAGIDWAPLPYRRRPPLIAGWWNSYRLGRQAARLHRERNFDIVHARSDLASLAGRSLWRNGDARFLYDMRALWPDERVDGGAWPQSSPLFRAIYRKFKRHQDEFITRADAIICLTNDAKSLLEGWPGRRPDADITVIPCSTDFDHFSPATAEARLAARQRLGISRDEKVLIYLGSIGSWYMLDEMLDFFGAYRDRHPSARFLLVTPDRPGQVLSAAKEHGLADAVLVREATREEVPAMLAAADLGLFFIRPVPSKRASCPTKLGEMLASGLRIVANGGVGDVDAILRETGGGVTVRSFDRMSYEKAIDVVEALPHDPAAARSKALAWFDVERGIAAYDQIYRKLLTAEGIAA